MAATNIVTRDDLSTGTDKKSRLRTLLSGRGDGEFTNLCCAIGAIDVWIGQDILAKSIKGESNE